MEKVSKVHSFDRQ